MHGIINRIIAVNGKRDELITLMLQGVEEMPGCQSYIVSADATDADMIWVTEVWDSEASQEASLAIPAIKAAVDEAMPLIAGFESIAATKPAGGVGLKNQ